MLEVPGMAEKIVNGVNVDALMETVGAVKDDPSIADFKFRVKNTWVKGTKNHATIQSFYGAKEEHSERKARLDYDIDEPPILLGEDSGPNPVEFLLVGLSGCITTTLVANAAARGVEFRSLESELEGDLDLRGFLDLDPNVPVGYKEIRLTFTVDSDATQEQLDELAAFARDHSPVSATIRNPTPVNVRIAKKEAAPA
jgi:uncharacterized OsmC-like protein